MSDTWRVGPVDDTLISTVHINGDVEEVATVSGDYENPKECPIMEKRARLIASAPAMRDALKAIASMAPYSPPKTDEYVDSILRRYNDAISGAKKALEKL